MVITILKLIATIFSFIGICIFIYKKTKININFLPILTIGVITIVMFIGGIINILDHTCLGLILFGIYNFIQQVIIFIKKNKINRNIINLTNYIGIIVTTIIFSLVAYSLRNMIYFEYDNFTHWGLILKEMFKINSLPDMQTIIEFKLYPPGTALFIYYITRIFGFKESYTIIAQAFMLFMGILPIFTFYSFGRENKNKNKNKKILNTIWNSITYILILIIILSLNPYRHLENLLVDVVLATTALTSTLSIIYYKKDINKMLISQLIFSILIILIKNSGVIFIIFNTILALIYVLKYNLMYNESKKKAIINIVIIFVIIPIIIFFLWSRYTVKAYQTKYVGASTHAMSPINYYKNLITKDSNLIKEISFKVIKESVNLKAIGTAIETLVIIQIFILLQLIYFVIRKDKRWKNIFKLILYINGIYFTYILGLLLMYIFSMPVPEAKVIAGFHRYETTIVIYILGIVFSKLISIENTGNNRNEKAGEIYKYITISILIISLLVLNKNNINIFKRNNIIDEKRIVIENLLEDNIELRDKKNKTLIYSNYSQNLRGYITRIVRYILLNRNISSVDEKEYILNKKQYHEDNNYIMEINENSYGIYKTEKEN